MKTVTDPSGGTTTSASLSDGVVFANNRWRGDSRFCAAPTGGNANSKTHRERFRTMIDCLKSFLCVATFSLLSQNLSSAATFSELVVFGASMSDTGNVAILSPPVLGFSAPPSPPYYMGRFSNGPVWVDVLSDQLGLERPAASEAGGTNYTFGGATTGSVENPFTDAGLLDMDAQLEAYLAEHTPSGHELFLVTGTSSGNDFDNGQTTPAEPVAFIGRMVSKLGVAGARNILVTNAIESVNLRRSDLLGPFNELLSVEIEAQRTANPGLTIYEFDADEVINTILAEPSAIGISNLTGQACEDCGGGTVQNPTQVVANPNDFLLWDNVHFSAPVHEALGIAAFQAVPEPSSGLLATVALIWLSFGRCPRRLRNDA